MKATPIFENERIRIYYEVIGSGLPLVFLHPPGMGHLTFRHQRQLAASYRLIFLDLPNSDRHAQVADHTVESYAALVYELIEALELVKVVVCGYSNGGSIAQEFAIRYPERTAGVILIGGFSEVSTFLLKKQFQLGIWTAEKGLLPLFSFILSRSHFETKKERQEMARMIKTIDPQALKQAYEHGMTYTATDRLHRISAPVLLIYGRLDFYIRSYLLPFCARLKDVDVVFVSDVAHQIPTKRAHECNAIIDQWLKRKVTE